MDESQSTLSQLLTAGAKRLESVSDSPKLDCQLLLCHVLKCERSWLYSHGDDLLDAREYEQFQKLLDQRGAGQPLAYLVGYRHFWKRSYEVTNHTLVPRPETEILIEAVLERRGPQPQTVLDLGTGTGAIAISLAEERPKWRITAVDISAEALTIARKNAEGLDNLHFRQGNWCKGIEAGSQDIIVSNPPYIREDDPHLETLNFEPRRALVAGQDGLDCIKEIVPASYHCLVTGGLLVIEHGYDQQATVKTLFDNAGFNAVETLQDLAGNPRAVLGIKNA